MGVDSCAMEREPRLMLAARDGRTGRSPSTPPRPSRSTRERRLRERIDSLLHQRHLKELRILELERRVRHWECRFVDVSAELREARRVA